MQTRRPLNFSAVRIAGKRIKLVPMSFAFSESIFREFTDEITRYMIPATPSSIEEVNVFIQSSIRDMNDNIDLTLAILKKDNEEFLGVCGLHGRMNPTQPALGIWLKKTAHGQKFGQEAMKILVDWARQNIILNYMVYPCDRDNIASRKIAECLGGSVFRTAEVTAMSGRILNEIAYKIP